MLTECVVHSLTDAPVETPTLAAFTNDSYRECVHRLVEDDALTTKQVDDVDLLAPVPDPDKLVCVGLNYRDRAEEVGEDLPEKRLLLGKASTAVTHPEAPIRIPPGIEEVDWEVELAVVIRQTPHRVDPADALEYVTGYTIVSDVSGRDAQFADGQRFRGKSFDTFAPMDRPWPPARSSIRTRPTWPCEVNGEAKHDSNTDQFIFDVPELVEYVSYAMTLEPGDVISTGIPSASERRVTPGIPVTGGSVEAEIDGIRTLTSPVVDGQ